MLDIEVAMGPGLTVPTDALRQLLSKAGPKINLQRASGDRKSTVA